MKRRVGLLAVILAAICTVSAQAMTVYYNTEGGRYYHADPHCEAISAEYWDDMAETTTAYTDRLGLRGPCARCFEEGTGVPAEQIPARDAGDGKMVTMRFGGSNADEISDLACTPEGNVVLAGYTASSDGTLSDRTKTGWSGWTAMVDAQGNTLWNFCSRYASRDRMRAPVVHENGTITVLLESRGSEYDQVELIRLDMRGGVLERKPLVKLMQGDGACAPETPGVFCGGYVIATYDADKRIEYEPGDRYARGAIYQPVYHWFDFDGNLLLNTQTFWHRSIAAVSDRHVIEAIDQTYWLCALDEKGTHTKKAELYEGLRRDMEYRDLVSLEDGGALAALYVHGGNTMRSAIRRFDAQGNLLSEMVLEDFCVNVLQVCGNRLIAGGETAQSQDMILVFDENGTLMRRECMNGLCLQGQAIVTPDEQTAVFAQKVDGGHTGGGDFNWDAQLSVISLEQ